MRLDGSSQMMGNLNAGSNRVVNVADAAEDGDAVSRSYGNSNYAPLSHTHNSDDINDGHGSGLDADLLDGYEGATYYHPDLNPIGPPDIGGQGHTPDNTGLNADMLDGYHATDFYNASDKIDYVDDLTNVPTTFQPVTASQTIIGGVKIWVDGDTLHIETTP
jgi:hypothetical protein